MVTCQRCSIKFAHDGDEDTDDDDNCDNDDEDELEMQEVEAHMLSEHLTPDSSGSPIHSLVNAIYRLDISGSPSNVSNFLSSHSCVFIIVSFNLLMSQLSIHDSQSPECDPNVAPVPQHQPKQRSLKMYVYQAIAHSLAM
jgi:hypothetical protein